MSPEQANVVLQEADLLYDSRTVEAALDRLAASIAARLAERTPVILCVMLGGIVPTGMLLPRLGFPLELDYLHATRYQGGTRGGELNWIVRPKIALQGRTVLVVDDILDEGVTLQAILSYCWSAGATEALSAVLVDKQHPRKHGMRADFVGLTVEDRYVFGYGMDFQNYWRNAAGIYAVSSIVSGDGGDTPR